MDTFTYCGKNSAEMGVIVEKMPNIIRAQRRDTATPVPGRHGSLHTTDNCYDEIALSIDCFLRDPGDLNKVCSWLVGSGDLILSNMPEYAYRARVINQIPFIKVMEALEQRRFAVIFQCDPFRYEADPGASFKTMSWGGIIINPGTVPSDPVITVYGAADIILLVGGGMWFLNGLQDKITINSETKLAYREVGSVHTLMTNAVSSETNDWPSIPPGPVPVNWAGAASKVEIKPNWRWL